MSRLDEDDIEKLFSGAPQFYARNEGPFLSVPNPSVAFPFDEELQIRDLTDHVQIEARAWSGVTTHPHLTRDVNHDATVKEQADDCKKSHFFVRCRERPNMLSLHGLEKGTMGFQAALELAVSDSLEEEQFGFDSIGKKAKAIIDARQHMLSHDGWLHRVPESEVLGRLQRNSELYRANDLKERTSWDTYNDLFRSFMRPRYVAIDKKDNHSLTNQIVALLKCLGTANVWIDLSHVEWRIRLGQILWGEPHGDRVTDGTHIHNPDSASDLVEEKYWLLLQILLATELLVRLDAVTQGAEYGAGAFRPIDIVQFERAATPTVKWSLLLARSWLDNIQVVKEDGNPAEADDAAPPNKKLRGVSWLATLVSKISLHPSRYGFHPPSPPYHYVIKGRNGQRQVDGLVHFAKKLGWPGIDAYEAYITGHLQEAVVSKPDTSMCGCGVDEKGSSAFGAYDVTCQRGHHKERARARRRKLAAALHPSGWMSKSYIFGLMLPGEGLSHFLMASLLENDAMALSKLGSFANLGGGFVYSGKSFWSATCVVGRVLAAGAGSAECMGWISSNIVPDDVDDGWLNVEVRDVTEDLLRLGKKSRIWAKRRLEKESSIIGDGMGENLSPADFTMPWENRYAEPPPNVDVSLLSLKFSPPSHSVQPTPLAEIVPTSSNEHGAPAPELPSHPVSTTFMVGMDGQPDKQMSFALTYDVNFVTAHPCSPPRGIRFVKSASSPTIQEIDVSGADTLGSRSRSVYRMGEYIVVACY
jgi:hypothetical protein